jgi:alpha-ribazole phosphatase
MTRILCVRHGTTDWNAQSRLQGQADIPLNSLGLQQARAIAARLASEKIDRVYSSPLVRACRTAEHIRAQHKTSLSLPQIIPDKNLQEISFGEWEGLTFSEIEAQDPIGLAAWRADFLHQAPPGGESLAQLASRVNLFYSKLIMEAPQETILIVAHGGPLQVIICLALGLSPQRYWQYHLTPASLTEINTYPEGGILNLLNDTCHLQSSGGHSWES